MSSTDFFSKALKPSEVSFEINPRSKYFEQRDSLNPRFLLTADSLVKSYVSLLSQLEGYEANIDNPIPPRNIRSEMHNCINSLYLPNAYKRSLGVSYISRAKNLSDSELKILDRTLKAIFKEPTERYMNYVYGLSKHELGALKTQGRRICKYLRYPVMFLQRKISHNLTDDDCYNFDFELLTWTSAVMIPFCFNRVFDFSSSEYEDDFEDLLDDLNYELIEESFKYLFETAGRRVAIKLSVFDEFNLDTETLLNGDFGAWNTLLSHRKDFLDIVNKII